MWYCRPSQNLQSTSKTIIEELNPEEGKQLQDRVDNLMKRWRALLTDLAARREKYVFPRICFVMLKLQMKQKIIYIIIIIIN